jgi:hypothetical protein
VFSIKVNTPPYFSGLFCFSSGITDLLLFGIVSRPWSPFASLPPDVDVPLPLLFGAMPLVSDDLEAELAAGRGVPGPPGLLCAYASEPDMAKAAARKAAESFIAEFLLSRGQGKTARGPLCSAGYAGTSVAKVEDVVMRNRSATP